MGQRGSSLEEAADVVTARRRAEASAGRLGVLGRYHQLPRKLEDDYCFQADEVLGAGANGEVKVVKNRQAGMKFAVKSTPLEDITPAKGKEIETELEIFLTVDHPHLARLVDVYEASNSLMMVMEILEGGELYDRVAATGPFSEVAASDAVRQMLLAINYLHSFGIVHRDLKLENWLYDKKNGNHLKLIDFGLSKYWEENRMMALRVGTLNYIAPEVFGQSYTSQCDLWSTGVIAYILMDGGMPFTSTNGDEEMVRCICEGEYTFNPEPWGQLSLEAREFVSKLLKVDPTLRLTAAQALTHPWIHADEPADGSRSRVTPAIVSAMRSFAQVSIFRRVCMAAVAWSLSNDERATVRDAFIELDQDHLGRITFDQLSNVLTGRFGLPSEEVRCIFDALCPPAASQEVIHYSDFLSAMISTRIALHDVLLRFAFSRLDVDNSGYITVDNLLVLLGRACDDETARQLLAEADELGDGVISFEEFCRYMHSDRGKVFLRAHSPDWDTSTGIKLTEDAKRCANWRKERFQPCKQQKPHLMTPRHRSMLKARKDSVFIHQRAKTQAHPDGCWASIAGMCST